jgi:Trypsin
MLAGAPPAGAVVGGSMSSLGSYTVRLVGKGYCSGVVIARRVVATAAHCAHGMQVMTGSGSLRVIGVSRSALLDDGRRVSVSGDGAFLQLAAPLPSGVGPPPIGAGSGDSFTIAGYGTLDERAGGAFGSLHEATLVPAGARALIDPHRSGAIGASACFGDSGGPVMRGGMLVGVITRAAHPSPRIACGKLTRWAAITVRGQAREGVAASNNGDVPVAEPRRAKHRRHARRAHEADTHSAGLFGSWFSEKAETRRHARKSARHQSATR